MVIFSMSFYASFAILAVAALRRVLIHKLPKKTFMLLWAIIIFRLLIPVSIPSRLSIWSIIDNLDSAPSIAELLSGTATKPASGIVLPLAMPKAVVETMAANIRGLALGGSSSPAGSPLLLCLYLAGACICVLCFLLPHLRCRKLYKTALPAENGFIRQWIAIHPLRRSLHITQSDKVDTPLTYGIWNPVILLPRTTDWQNETQLSYILTHEYAHIKRFDILWKLALALTLAVHWFNPFVWLMYILANRDIELACDETVVRSCGENIKSLYAMALVNLEEKRIGLLSLCNNFSKNAIEERIVSILKIKKVSFIAVFAAFLIISGVTMVFATDKAAAPKSDFFSTADYDFNSITGTLFVRTNSGATNWKTTNLGNFGQADLKRVLIDSTVTSIGNFAFANCMNLSGVTFLSGEQPVFGSNVFLNDQALTVTVPPGNFSAYQAKLAQFPPGTTIVDVSSFTVAIIVNR